MEIDTIRYIWERHHMEKGFVRTVRLAIGRLQSSWRRFWLNFDPHVKIADHVYLGGRTQMVCEDGGSIELTDWVHARGDFHLQADGGRIEIGGGCFFNHNAAITSREHIKIGHHCVFGNNLVMVDHDHNFRNIGENEFLTGPIVLEDEVWVGANVTILRNTVIEKGAVIGAGSVVKGRVPAGSVYTTQQIGKKGE